MHTWTDGADADEVGDSGNSQCRSGEAFARNPSLGSTPMGARVTAQLHHDERYYGGASGGQQNVRRRGLRDRMGLGGLGALWGDEEFEDM